MGNLRTINAPYKETKMVCGIKEEIVGNGRMRKWLSTITDASTIANIKPGPF
jgi:hypothetical protein